MGLAFCGAGQALGLDSPPATQSIRPTEPNEGELEDVGFECQPCGPKTISWGEGEEEEGREIKGQKTIPGPSEEEYEAHMRTHIPYRKWCPFCVKGKRIAEGRRVDKEKVKRDKALVSLEYMKQKRIIE